LQTKIVLL